MESELEQTQAAKSESDNQVSELRKEVDPLSTEFRELRLEVELRVSKGMRLEMKRTQDRELNTHEELRRSIVQRIAEKDVTIADKNAVIVDLRTSSERDGSSILEWEWHPRVEDSDRTFGQGKLSDCQHYRRSRGVASMTMERTNGGSLKLGSMLSFCIGVTKKSCSNLSCT